jgi:ribosomal protein S18 acetylase RimI-like enzyme
MWDFGHPDAEPEHFQDDLSMPEFDIEIDMLGVLEPWRGRGVGTFLLHHAFADLARRGFTSVRLNVDAANATGATRLYERGGMRVRREHVTYERSLAG